MLMDSDHCDIDVRLMFLTNYVRHCNFMFLLLIARNKKNGLRRFFISRTPETKKPNPEKTFGTATPTFHSEGLKWQLLTH